MTSYETVDELRDFPIHDNGEPLVDFVKAGLAFARQHPVFPFPRVHLLRQSVVERLVHAVSCLPPEWHFVIVEGFRTLEVQRMQHDANRRRFESLYPDMPRGELQALLEDFSAPPDVAGVPPPHTTGGALDLRLMDAAGNQIDLISPFDMHQPESAAWDAPVSSNARRNREILKHAMETAGITNYPGEYWHWSYGDQGWAHRGGHPAAIYSRLDYTVAEAETLQGEPANRETPLYDWAILTAEGPKA